MAELKTLSWLAIVRLGLIQTCLGALIFLPTNTLNRIMVVEYALAASIPGFLITLHHVVQLARPYIGYGSDAGGRRTHQELVKSVTCFERGTVHVEMDESVDVSIEELFPTGAILVVSADVFGACSLFPHLVVTPGADEIFHEDGFLRIRTQEGTPLLSFC